jgi:uncharacterized protein
MSRIEGRTHVRTRLRAAPIQKILLASAGASTHATALVAMGQRGAIADDQVRWLSVREACGGTVSCLDEAYRNRIGELTRILDGIVARGPF